MAKKSQEQIIIEHMRKHGHISMLEALGVHRIFNLQGRIADLRIKHGKDFIVTEMKTDDTGKKYASYSLGQEHVYAA